MGDMLGASTWISDDARGRLDLSFAAPASRRDRVAARTLLDSLTLLALEDVHRWTTRPTSATGTQPSA
jgi:hypothetical protein